MELHNIRVVQSPLNFELALHLAEKVELLEHVLEDDFESNWDASATLCGLKDLAELATAHGLDASEVVHSPTVSFFFSCFLSLDDSLLLVRSRLGKICHLYSLGFVKL